MVSSKKKLRIMVLFGGRSGEHEVSLRSAASVIRHLDPERFEIVPVAIDKSGKWLLNDISLIEKSALALSILGGSPSVFLPPHPGSAEKGLIESGGKALSSSAVDVIFPVMHGPLYEDGTIQGLFELTEIPYVGCGVLGSAVGMDKEIAKRLVRDAGLPIVPYVAVKQANWNKNKKEIQSRISKELGFPVFVKPANQGSSVGVHKVKEPSQLESALQDAFRYDTKILIEKAVDAREIEFAVLENIDPDGMPLVSAPGEIIPTHEFYSYEAKYLDDHGAKLLIPARISPAQILDAQKVAREAFEALECEGLARVDFFVDKQTGAFYFNEVNTLPGFTSISMYPKLWEYSGIPYKELLSRLIDLAIARHQKKKNLVRDFQ